MWGRKQMTVAISLRAGVSTVANGGTFSIHAAPFSYANSVGTIRDGWSLTHGMMSFSLGRGNGSFDFFPLRDLSLRMTVS